MQHYIPLTTDQARRIHEQEGLRYQDTHGRPEGKISNLKLFSKSSRFYKRQDPFMNIDALAMGKNEFEDLEQLQNTVNSWEDKLVAFAEKFSDDPGILQHNPYWKKLLKVRDNLRLMLAKKRLNALDRTRM